MGSEARRVKRALAVLVALAAMWIAGVAAAGDVRGTVRAEVAPRAAGAEAKRPYYWEEWNGVLEARPERVDLTREIAVVLTGTGSVTGEATPIVRFVGGGLSPSTVVLKVGSTLRLRNDDDFAHELYAENLVGFSAEATSATAARTVPMREAGNWALRDRRVPHVRGHLHVVADLVAVAAPDADGKFVFTGVTPGSYVLKVYQGPREVSSRPIVVADARELVVDPIQLGAAAH